MRRAVLVRRVSGAVASLIMAGGLSACGGSYGFEAPKNGGTTLGNLLAFNSPNAPSPAPQPTDHEEAPTCPPIEVQDGTASSRVYAGTDQTNAEVRTQFSLGDVVRECAHAGSELSLKVGVEGRVLLGPKGTPGSFSAPVRIAVRDEKSGKAVYSKLYQVPVTIPSGEGGAGFSLVSDPIAVPYLSAHADDDYTVLVGFDSKGSGSFDSKPSRPRKKPHHRR